MDEIEPEEASADEGEAAGEAGESGVGTGEGEPAGEAEEVPPGEDGSDSSGEPDPEGSVDEPAEATEEEFDSSGEDGAEGEEGEPLPEDEGEGAASEDGEDQGDAAEDDVILYTMTGEEPGETPPDGESDESGEGEGKEGGEAGSDLPPDDGEIILMPGEADPRGSDGALSDDQIYMTTTSAGGLGGRGDDFLAQALSDARIEAMLAIRSEWADLPAGACIF